MFVPQLLLLLLPFLVDAQYRAVYQTSNLPTRYPDYNIRPYQNLPYYPQIPQLPQMPQMPQIPQIPHMSPNYNAYPYPYPYPYGKKPIDPYDRIPTEIVDVDEVSVKPVQIPDQSQNSYSITIGDPNKPNTNSFTNKTIHLIESKPIISKFHRVITSDGTKSQVLNVHMFNGVEVTTTEKSLEPPTTTEAPEEDKEVSEEDPKPVKSWFFG